MAARWETDLAPVWGVREKVGEREGEIEGIRPGEGGGAWGRGTWFHGLICSGDRSRDRIRWVWKGGRYEPT